LIRRSVAVGARTVSADDTTFDTARNAAVRGGWGRTTRLIVRRFDVIVVRRCGRHLRGGAAPISTNARIGLSSASTRVMRKDVANSFALVVQ